MSLKFLIDNALSPIFSIQLKDHGYDAIHVKDVQMGTSPDEDIFDFAQKEGRIVVSADTDFGTIIALRNASFPSIIIFRRSQNRRPKEQTKLLLANLPQITPDLEKGSIVIIEDKRIRIRNLPIMQ
jgi:predicted nuclease of predicted toxin-antitoxin system